MEFEPGKIHKTFQTKSGKDCIIRWAKKDDVGQLKDFINELAEEDTFIIFSPGDNMSLEAETEFLENNLKKDAVRKGSFIVAEIDGKIVGTTDVRLDEHGRKRSEHVAIFGISVSAKYRGEGLGNELMKMALDHAQNFLQNIRLVRLTAFAENHTAISLYKKHGFKEAGIIPGAYLREGKYSDEVSMYKELTK